MNWKTKDRADEQVKVDRRQRFEEFLSCEPDEWEREQIDAEALMAQERAWREEFGN